MVKNLSASVGKAKDAGSIPELGRSPGVGNGNPLQYSCLESSMDRGVWLATVQGVAKNRPWLSSWTHTHQIGRNAALDWTQVINMNGLTRQPGFCVLAGACCDNLYIFLMNICIYVVSWSSLNKIQIPKIFWSNVYKGSLIWRDVGSMKLITMQPHTS